jgi:hypothetical protein
MNTSIGQAILPPNESVAIFFPGRVFRKLRASQMWRGGDPLPPSPSFDQSGGYPPLRVPEQVGITPHPSGPGRANRDPAGKTVKFPPHDGSSTRTPGSGYAAREVIPGMGWRGVIPHPLPFVRSKWGAPSPPCVRASGGYPPL